MEGDKEKYTKALDRARNIYGAFENKDILSTLATIFPELKESENERIKTNIIKLLRFVRDTYHQYSDECDEAIAWVEKQGEKTDVIENFDTEFEKQVSHLIASAINKEHEYNQDYVKWTANALLNYAKHELEKQGKQKPADKVEPKFKVGNKIKLVEEPKYPAREIIAIKNDAYCFDKLEQLPFINQDKWELIEQTPADKIEQNPAWNEEDEKMCKNLLFLMEQENSISSWEGCYEWLKSLKDRYTWKPSKEQMIALQESIGIVGVLTPRGEYLRELLEQLKKLKEE